MTFSKMRHLVVTVKVGELLLTLHMSLQTFN